MPLTKTALITAILGTAVLLFLSQNLEPETIKISEINSKMLEQQARIEGKIASLKTYETLATFVLADETGEMTVVAYNLGINQNLTGKSAIVIGRIKEYKGKLEIEATKIQEK